MKKAISILVFITVLSLAVFTGCAPKADFSYSDGISDTGYWKGVKARKKVDLCEYTGISVPADIHTVSDASVQGQIDSIVSEYAADEQLTDRAIEDGDTVNIDYVGSVDGVEFEGGSTGGQGTAVTIGVTQYIDDFLEQLIGHTPGESFDIEVTFPEDYGKEELNGKDAVFAITVNHIVVTVNPELTDDFVSENLSGQYGWNTVDEMREGIRGDLQRQAVSDYVQNYVIDNTTVKSVPDRMIKYQENTLMKFYRDYAETYQMEFDAFLTEYVGVSSIDELLTEYKEDMTQSATFNLVMQAVAEDADLSVSDEDVTAFFKDDMGIDDYSEEQETYGMPYIKMMVLQRHVVDYLVENADLV